MTPDERARKNREIRLRSKARRYGLIIEKSRRRDRYVPSFGTYRLLDAKTNAVIWGLDEFESYGLSLDDIEDYIKREVQHQ